MGRTLYATDDPKRYFYVPDEATLPEGDFVVRTLTGRAVNVDPMVIDVYEVPEDEAKRIIASQLRELGDKVRGFLGAMSRALKEAPPVDPAAEAAREQRVAENLAMGREELRDPDKMAAAVGNLVKGVLHVARETVQDPAVAEARMKDVAEALRQEGAGDTAAASVEEIPRKLREVLQSEDILQKLDEAAERLRKATAELEAEMATEKLVKGREPGEA